MRWFDSPIKALIGIDISARYIKLIVLKKTNSADHPVEIQHFAVVELPMMVLTEGNDIKDHATISSTLIQLKTNDKVLTNPAAIALPGSAVVTKQIVLNNESDPNLLEDQVWLEAAKHFPDLIEDLSLDFYNHGPLENDENQVDILLVACRKTSIEKRLNVLQDSHFQVQVVDVDYYALERALRFMLQYHDDFRTERSYGLLNFSTRSSTLIVMQNHRLCYAHDQSFDTQQLLQKLQQQLQWPDIVGQPARLPNDLDADAIAVLDEALSGHIQHVLQLFYSSNQDSPIDQLFLAGDCAVIPHIAKFIGELTSLDVTVANPLTHMQIAKQIDPTQLQVNAPLLCLCTGLALNIIDHDLH